MSSRFLASGGGDGLESLQDGSTSLNLAGLTIAGLIPNAPLRASSGLEIESGLISLSDCSFTPLTGLTSAGGTGTISLLGPTAGSLKALTATGGVALTGSSAAINLGVPALDASRGPG